MSPSTLFDQAVPDSYCLPLGRSCPNLVNVASIRLLNWRQFFPLKWADLRFVASSLIGHCHRRDCFNTVRFKLIIVFSIRWSHFNRDFRTLRHLFVFYLLPLQKLFFCNFLPPCCMQDGRDHDPVRAYLFQYLGHRFSVFLNKFTFGHSRLPIYVVSRCDFDGICMGRFKHWCDAVHFD